MLGDVLDPLEPGPGVGGARSGQRHLLRQVLDLATNQLVALGDIDHAVGGLLVGDRAFGVAYLTTDPFDAFTEPTRFSRVTIGLGAALIIKEGVGDGAGDQRS